MSTCGTCTHGQHLRAHGGRSTGFVACDLGEKSCYVAGSTSCTRGRYERRRSAEPEFETAAPVPAANYEQRWWEST